MSDEAGVEVTVVEPPVVVGRLNLPPCPVDGCGLVLWVDILAGVGRTPEGTIAILYDSDITDAAAHSFTHET